MKRLCQGYCGGYAAVEEMRQVGEHGERFCPECVGERKRREFYK